MTTLLYSGHKNGHAGLSGVIFIMSVIVLGAVIPAYHDAMAGIRPASKYRPVKISDNVPARPGAFAWSPDGKKIAFLTDKIYVYELENKKQKSIGIKSPLYISWSPANELMVIYKEDGVNALCLVNPENLAITRIKLQREVEAVYPVWDGRKIILLSYRNKVMRIGTDLHYTLFLYDRKKAAEKELYKYSRIYPSKNPDIKILNAWMHAGPNPLDASFLIMEHVKPPVLLPYSKIGVVDNTTGKTGSITGGDERKTYISAGWSPDGRRIAVANGDRHLEIRDLNGGSFETDNTILGLYPTWNRQGSQIFFGGYVIDSDGKNKEELLQNSIDSISQWSPDGSMLAVASHGEFWLFQDFLPHFINPDRPFDGPVSKKISVLKELLEDLLLTEDEYEERLRRLSRGPEAKP
jgi:WD40 repeat protein